MEDLRIKSVLAAVADHHVLFQRDVLWVTRIGSHTAPYEAAAAGLVNPANHGCIERRHARR